MSVASLAPRFVRAIMAYQPGKPISSLLSRDGDRRSEHRQARLQREPARNESEGARAAMAAVGDDLALSGRGRLRAQGRSAGKLGVQPEQLVVGNGSNDILSSSRRPSPAPGPFGGLFAPRLRGPPAGDQRAAPPASRWRRELRSRSDAMAAAIRARDACRLHRQPQQPDRHLPLGGAEEAFLGEVPRHVLVVLDEAYTEYPPAAAHDSIAWLARAPTCWCLRTFSKAYGLAGFMRRIRRGRPRVADLMNRVRQPFNVLGGAGRNRGGAGRRRVHCAQRRDQPAA